ncbi:MAG: hypothetical protein K6C36_02225 [Clostridia bacterium]|nr:hypothetical protein [Clostridia bacterium]
MARENRPAFVRYLLYFVLFLVGVLFQCTLCGRLSGLGYIVPLGACIGCAMYEFEFVSMAYGALCGICWDIVSPALSGFHALYLSFCCLAVGFLCRYYLRTNIKTFLLFSSLFHFLFYCLRYLSTFGFAGFEDGLGFILRDYVVPFALSLVLSVIVYFVFAAVHYYTVPTERK